MQIGYNGQILAQTEVERIEGVPHCLARTEMETVCAEVLCLAILAIPDV